MRVTVRGIADIFVKSETYLLIPFWVLSSALNRLGSALFTIDVHNTVWVLLAYVPFVW